MWQDEQLWRHHSSWLLCTALLCVVIQCAGCSFYSDAVVHNNEPNNKRPIYDETLGKSHSSKVATNPTWLDTDELLYKIFTRKQQHEYAQRQQRQWPATRHNNNNKSATWSLPPYFENSTQRSVVVAVGRNAELHCRVQNLGDRAVTWIRQRDLHILTIGVMTYTNDHRFEALHLDESNEWLLKIASVQIRDSGVYECQVSSEPKMCQAFELSALVAKAKILANTELVFKSGSDINLTCIDQKTPLPPSYIYWYKDGELINYSQRGGINVLTERLTRTSKLVIARVVPSDSGNYTCVPSNSNSDSVHMYMCISLKVNIRRLCNMSGPTSCNGHIFSSTRF